MDEENFTDGFKSRIVEFARSQYDKGQNNFEMFCGIPIGSINGPKKNGMAAINLAKIAERCPGLNLRWLLLGDGEMLERRTPQSAGGNVTTIGNVSGMTGSPVTVHGGGTQGQDGTMRVIEALTDQNKALIKQIETLTGIITNLTAKS